MTGEEWCGPDDCPASICNGPHVSHRCPNGDLVTGRVDDPAPCPFCGWTGRPKFVVGDVFEIRGRGPCITREVKDSHAARDAGEMFTLGDTVGCGDLRATIVGIERYPCGGPTGESQLALLLRGVAVEELEAGQTWEKVETVQQIKRRAAEAARVRHGDVLPDGYTVKWRTYGRGGRWRGVAPNSWVETADRDVVEWEMWWQVAADEKDAELSKKSDGR